MQILNGKEASQSIKDSLKLEVAQLAAQGKQVPHLVAILIGNNGASETYVASKVKSCQEIGFKSTLIHLESSISSLKLLDIIEDLNTDPEVDGILVQLPLPEHISEDVVINAIDASKDVDGFNPFNVGHMVLGQPTFLPATPYGIMLLLQHYKIETKGKHAVVVGRSNIVGRPMSILLSGTGNPGNCTVTICHSHTKNIKEFCQSADIIIAALGRPKFITEDMVKTGAVIIDVGITRVKDETKKSGYKIVGDVDFEAVAPKCSFITPVPGGVGPMTIAALMKNTFKACALKHDYVKND
ncbi:MAG TPA: bifunctional 5,10-methylenetetrahydrofolate dehydrogenase/5,10-methenyltetrahydrofolate cyclohydrolase [Flavisolibacter sp.]|nr:bifunctional 5,10-methylenetetrahydrofolate dehydrogenase/5,10-methenyltetrahydrofolate cyclohydrolase [Flavisolibacter sp.]